MVFAILRVLLVCLFFGNLASAQPASPQTAAEGSQIVTGGVINYDALQKSKVYHATRSTGPIVLDGHITEAPWQQAEIGGGFYQSEPVNGVPAPQKTEFRIVYDEANIYVAVDADQSGSITLTDFVRDFAPGDNDMLAIVFDTLDDDRNGFVFQTNPGSAQRDQQIINQVNNVNWDGVWEVKSAVRDGGWSAEFKIPFKTLRFDDSRPLQRWGFNILRIIPSKNERNSWSLGPRPFDALTIAVAGTLEGLGNIRRGRNLNLKPFAVSNFRPRLNPNSVLKKRDADVGLDVKYGITSSLTLDLTLNTDFSHVEADDQQVNLTRFSLFFPEKREFFLENAGIFTTGGSGSDLVPFFSRRIGLSQKGEPLPVEGGARLTGKMAGFDVGILNMQVGSSGPIAADNWSVLRLNRNVLSNSRIGGFAFNRDSTDAGNWNRTAGVDATFRFLRRRLVFGGVVMKSAAPDRHGRNLAANIESSYTDPFYALSGSYVTLQENFRNDFGFVRRGAIRQAQLSAGIKPRPRSGPIREVAPEVETDYVTDQLGRLLTRTHRATLRVSFHSGESVTLTRTMDFEQLDSAFSLRSDLVIPVGAYAFNDWDAEFQTSRFRTVYGSGGVKTGGFWNGESREYRLGLGVRYTGHFSTDVSWVRNAAQLPAGRLDTDLVRMRVHFAFSPRMFLDDLLQYNTDSKRLSSNIRFRFIHHPLSDVFVVYNDSRGILGSIDVDRAISIKVTRLFSF